MILCGFGNLERIMIHEAHDIEEHHWIDLVMDKDEATFYLTCCCSEDWEWQFAYDKTTYEEVKHIVMDCIFSCETVEELIDTLDEIFEEMLYGSEEEDDYYEAGNGDCCGKCGGCGKCGN